MSTEKHSFRVGLDARPLSTRVSGVGRLISEILKYFPDKINYEFILFSHLPIHESHQELLNLPNVSVQKGEGFFSKKGGLYFLFELPRQIRKMNLDVFWGS
ncbi:MAG TPA: glycosyltransferase family 1 protein, partial [Leptospiraceae bacterium]|nr:glycosyltransferase family 1 protein [Leptospiraceae bacterium]